MKNTLPQLTHQQLLEAQALTLNTKRRRYGVFARLLFIFMDVVYGKPRTLEKFKVLELIARVPYQTWEHVAYVAVTHKYTDTEFARRIYERIEESRAQQDNEQWHLLIIEEMLDKDGIRQGWFKYRVLPQIVAFLYYQLSWLLYVIRPKWSYSLNADFEDHAEHEYMHFVDENSAFETTPWISGFTPDYGPHENRADLFRQIGHDERVHKQESIDAIAEARFN